MRPETKMKLWGGDESVKRSSRKRLKRYFATACKKMKRNLIIKGKGGDILLL